ncbi:hmg-y-related protein b, partial [Phtheirospermum japonicum]
SRDHSNNINAITLKQIESTYGNLPSAHTTLLTHHLNKMKSAGQLAFLKNNYLKPDPNAPTRRGRGRPPKPKTNFPPGAALSPPHPRGRSPKSNDPSDPHPPTKPKPTNPTTSVFGRKRGQPPKAATTDLGVPLPSTSSGTPRGRGNTPKVKPALAAPVGA